MHLLLWSQRIDSADEQVKVGEPLLRRLIVKVHAHGDDGVIGRVVVRLLLHRLDKITGLPHDILIVEGLVKTVEIKAESSRWPVDVGKDAGEQVALVAYARTCLPHVLQCPRALSQVLVLIVNSAEEKRVKAHLRKERRLFS